MSGNACFSRYFKTVCSEESLCSWGLESVGRKGLEEVDKKDDYWIGVALALHTSKHPEIHCYTMDLLLSGQKVLVTLIQLIK